MRTISRSKSSELRMPSDVRIFERRTVRSCMADVRLWSTSVYGGWSARGPYHRAAPKNRIHVIDP